MRSYCPENFVTLGKAPPGHPPPPPQYDKIFPYFGFELKSCFTIASLFHMFIDMDERIAGEQDRQSQTIECPQGPSNSQIYIYIFVLHFSPYIKNWFSIVFPCCTYVSAVMNLHKLIFWCPGTPGFYVRVQYDPEKNTFFLSYFYLNSNGSYQIA